MEAMDVAELKDWSPVDATVSASASCAEELEEHENKQLPGGSDA